MGPDGALLIISLICIAIYFLPTIVAVNRDHTSKGGVIVINIFLGWTFLGWVIALAWAFSGKHS
ncbi:superinfection immunity protein [Azospirillum sp. TSA2s]|uniref:superinfection immunity protein n=1 Tax=Azospirillum sp. TSA2s TaxID=709810 RepID=UPI0010AB15A2|nr:superinfection immunity protein [Azospirillum sp. TSA2s]QCG97805.1 superinfection immunity protein [Azospirillum sp. TSA2s]